MIVVEMVWEPFQSSCSHSLLLQNNPFSSSLVPASAYSPMMHIDRTNKSSKNIDRHFHDSIAIPIYTNQHLCRTFSFELFSALISMSLLSLLVGWFLHLFIIIMMMEERDGYDLKKIIIVYLFVSLSLFLGVVVSWKKGLKACFANSNPLSSIPSFRRCDAITQTRTFEMLLLLNVCPLEKLFVKGLKNCPTKNDKQNIKIVKASIHYNEWQHDSQGDLITKMKKLRIIRQLMLFTKGPP